MRKALTALQVIIFSIIYLQLGLCQLDKISALQFCIRMALMFGIAGILQIIKIAVSTRNTHSRSKTKQNNLLK